MAMAMLQRRANVSILIYSDKSQKLKNIVNLLCCNLKFKYLHNINVYLFYLGEASS